MLINRLMYRESVDGDLNNTIRYQNILQNHNIFIDIIPIPAPYTYTLLDDQKDNGIVKLFFRLNLVKQKNYVYYSEELKNIIPFNFDKTYYPKIEYIDENNTYHNIVYKPSIVIIDGKQGKIEFTRKKIDHPNIFISFYKYVGRFPSSDKVSNISNTGDGIPILDNSVLYNPKTKSLTNNSGIELKDNGTEIDIKGSTIVNASVGDIVLINNTNTLDYKIKRITKKKGIYFENSIDELKIQSYPVYNNTVTVGNLNESDYSTILNAINYINTQTVNINNTWVVLIHPGIYNVTNIIIPSFVSLIGLTINNITINGNITLNDNTIVSNIIIKGSDTYDGINIGDSTEIQILNCVFDNCIDGISINDTTNLLNISIYNCKFINCDIGINELSSKFVDIFKCNFYSTTQMINGIYLSDGRCNINNVNIYGDYLLGSILCISNNIQIQNAFITDSTIGINIMDSLKINIIDTTIINCTRGIYEHNINNISIITMNNIIIQNSSTKYLDIETQDTILSLLNCDINLFKSNIDKAIINGKNNTSIFGEINIGDEKINGSLYLGSTPHINSMKVIQDNITQTGNNIDITNNISNGSNIFESLNINNCLYIGYNFIPFALLINIIQTTSTIENNDFYLEYGSTSSNWNPLHTQNSQTNIINPKQYNVNLFNVVEQQALRFHTTGPQWASFNMFNSNLFWLRIRVLDNNVTSNPIINSLKGIASCSFYNTSGVKEYFGLCKPSFCLSSGIDGFSKTSTVIASRNVQFASTTATTLVGVNNSFDSGVQSFIGKNIFIPNHLDRSHPIEIIIHWYGDPLNVIGGNVVLKCYFVELNIGDKLDGTQSIISITSQPLPISTSNSAEMKTTIFSKLFTTAKNNACLYVSVGRATLNNTFSGYINIINIEIQGKRWK